jgi:phosphoketolase
MAELAPKGERRMGANPHANGGLLLRDVKMPDFRDYAVQVTKPGVVEGEATRVQGQFIRDVFRLNADARNFRVFSPDETASNRWGDVFEVTNHHNLNVRGYKEEGTTTTPFDMAVRNDIDRFHLVKDVVDRVSSLGPCAAYLTQIIRDKLIDHQRYIRQYGEDMPEIRDWKWGARETGKTNPARK